jgi:hypothetical protein
LRAERGALWRQNALFTAENPCPSPGQEAPELRFPSAKRAISKI